MTITKTLTIELPEIEEYYPGQLAAYRRERIELGLVGFVNRFASKHGASVAAWMARWDRRFEERYGRF